MTTDIEWGYNCLTAGVHHGRPEALWTMPLLHAVYIYRRNVLQDFVIARIYNDAMQYVEHSDLSFTSEWAEQVKELAEKHYETTLQHKVGEISNYYKSPERRRDVLQMVELIKKNELNAFYQPLHGHDSINMLCRILGTRCSREATR